MQIEWIEHIKPGLFLGSRFRTFDSTFLQILPRLLNLQVNMKLQHSKVYLFSVQQKEIQSRLILGHHVIHSKVCAMKARLTSQKCSVTQSILATWQIVWVLMQEIPALVSCYLVICVLLDTWSLIQSLGCQACVGFVRRFFFCKIQSFPI